MEQRQFVIRSGPDALDGIRQLMQDRAGGAFGELLDIVPGRGVIRDAQRARKAVEAVADGDIERLAKDAVALLGIGNDLRVAAAHVQHDGVVRAFSISRIVRS